jgi:hypothetical protein
LILWLGIWLDNQYGQGDKSSTPRLAVEGVTVAQPMEFEDLLNNLAGDWLKLEPWSGRSINFHAGIQSSNRLISPVLLVALWVGLASLLFSLLWRRHSAHQFMAGLAILFLTGWLVLDMRWQRQLSSRLVETYERYGHLPITERQKAMPDAQIASAVDRLRQALPEQPTRLLILVNDPNGYVTNRVRYHFLPNRVYATDRLPSPGRIHEGDHILVMAHPEMARFDQERGLLINGKISLAVEFLSKIPGFGTLYRVSGGN